VRDDCADLAARKIPRWRPAGALVCADIHRPLDLVVVHKCLHPRISMHAPADGAYARWCRRRRTGERAYYGTCSLSRSGRPRGQRRRAQIAPAPRRRADGHPWRGTWPLGSRRYVDGEEVGVRCARAHQLNVARRRCGRTHCTAQTDSAEVWRRRPAGTGPSGRNPHVRRRRATATRSRLSSILPDASTACTGAAPRRRGEVVAAHWPRTRLRSAERGADTPECGECHDGG
jgi:hypothetical protein